MELIEDKNPDSEETLVISHLMEALDMLETDGILHVCIFKKNQHGGLREIYVLDIYGRIVQKVIEDFARTILSEFESETMTHPKNKFDIPNKHNNLARKSYGMDYKTYATSDDAAKWNQGHYVTKFMTMFCALLPKSMHGCIIRILQLWLNKRIKISDDLLEIFNLSSDKAGLKTRDEVVQKIYNAYNGSSSEIWMDMGKSYIKTESGMMQGILHYTSSLFHTLFLDYLSFYAKNYLSSQQTLMGFKNISNIVNNMQSSDDSSMIISVPCEDQVSDFKISLYILSIFHLKEALGLHLGIYKSLKSTMMTLFVMEFNSEFFFYGDVHRPTFRWVNASILISEQDNLIGRQEEFYSLTTNIIQGGGSLILSHICHLAQGLLHYRLLGNSVSEIWPLYSNKIKESFDPSLGFFLVDHPLATGLAGLNYLVWLHCKNTTLGEKYKDMFLSELYNKVVKMREITLETSSIGLFSRSTQVIYGSSHKWENIMKGFKIDDDWMDEIDKNPRILYFRPSTIRELEIKLMVKMRSPGVISSLGKSNTIPRIIASSVFILSRPVLTTNSAYYKNLHGVDHTIKINLTSDLLLSQQRTSEIMLNTKEFKSNYSTEDVIQATVKNNFRHYDIKRSLCELIYKNFYENQMSFELFYSGFKNYDNNKSENTSIYQIMAFFSNKTIICCKSMGLNYLIRDIYHSDSGTELVLINIGDDFLSYIIPRNIIRITSELKKQQKNKFSPTEELILFPNKVDYEIFNSILSNMNLGRSVACKNLRRRMKSDLYITGNENSNNFKMESTLIWKWFQENHSHLSIPTLDTLYNDIRDSLPWIRRDIQATLLCSPFLTHIQLQNFISRQDKGNRVVHLVGSFGRTKYGLINISSVIRSNYSNGVIFKDIVDTSSKVKSISIASYLHIATLLSRYPLEENYKKSLIFDLLRKGPNLRLSTIPSSKVNKLSIIQKFIRLNPDLSLPSLKQLNPSEILKIRDKTMKLFDDKVRLENRAKELEEESTKFSSINDFMDSLDDWDRQLYYFYTEEEPEDWLEEFKKYYFDNPSDDLKEVVSQCGQTNAISMIKHCDINTVADLNNKRSIFSNLMPSLMLQIKDLKLGVFGFYDISQHYDKKLKRYIGPGQWRGTFDDVYVVINVIGNENHTTELESVVMSSSRNFQNTLFYLKTWCEDNNVENSSSIRKVLQKGISYTYCYLKNFEVSSVALENSAVISLNPSMVNMDENRFNGYSISINERSLRLLGYYNRVGSTNADRFVTLLQIPLNLDSIIIDFKQTMMEDFNFIKEWPNFIKDWVSYTPLSKTDDKILPSINSRPINLKKIRMNDEAEDWLIQHWNYRCQTKFGDEVFYDDDLVIEGREQDPQKCDPLSDKETINLFKELHTKVNLIVAEQQSEIKELTGLVWRMYDSLQEFNDFDYQEDYKDNRTILKIHPYFDGLIDRLGVNDIRKILYKKEHLSRNLIQDIGVPYYMKDVILALSFLNEVDHQKFYAERPDVFGIDSANEDDIYDL